MLRVSTLVLFRGWWVRERIRLGARPSFFQMHTDAYDEVVVRGGRLLAVCFGEGGGRDELARSDPAVGEIRLRPLRQIRGRGHDAAGGVPRRFLSQPRGSRTARSPFRTAFSGEHITAALLRSRGIVVFSEEELDAAEEYVASLEGNGR